MSDDGARCLSQRRPLSSENHERANADARSRFRLRHALYLMVEYRSMVFRNALVGLFIALIIGNVVHMLMSDLLLPLVAVGIQSALLYAVVERVRLVKTFVQIWAAALAASGLIDLAAAYALMPWSTVLLNVAAAGVGIAVFFLSERYILLVRTPPE